MKQHSSIRPPRLADKLFEWYCDNAAIEDLHGDMEELFYSNLKKMPVRRARVKYCIQVLSLMFSYAIRKRKRKSAYHPYANTSMNMAMIQSYFKIGIRNLLKYKGHSFINIAGLALGMSICLAIVMVVADQMMYDRYNSKHDRIFRVYSISADSENTQAFATAPLPLREQLLEKFNGVEKAVRFKSGFGSSWTELQNTRNNIPLSGFFADPEVLEVFEYELEYGDPKTALTAPFSVVLTKKAAAKLFEKQDPTGESIKVGDLGIYKVTGILKESGHRSHIVFEALASMSSLKSLDLTDLNKFHLNDWQYNSDSWLYVLLEKGKSEADIQKNLNQVQHEHYDGPLDPTKSKWKFALQSLTNISPGVPKVNEIGPFVGWHFVYLIIGLALIVLLTACFNFTNLSIARSLTRAREIGIRKVTGAARFQIFTQFLSESVLIAWLSLFIALFLLWAVKPALNNLNVINNTQFDFLTNLYVYAFFFFFATGVGVMAGFFPAVVLSGLQPIKVLKNLSNLKVLNKLGLRKTLVVAQFTVSLVFIVTTLVVYNQMKLFVHSDYGFDMKSKMLIRLNQSAYEPLKVELSKQANITNVAALSHAPATFPMIQRFKKTTEDKDWMSINYFAVDEDYLQNIDVTLVAGRNFSGKSINSNKSFVILNEQAVQAFHFSDPIKAIGESVLTGRDTSSLQIIGVVKDFNHEMLTERIRPMVLIYNPDEFRILLVKFSGDKDGAIQSIDQAWNKVNPGLKLDANSLEDEILKPYNSVMGDVVRALAFAAFVAIVICCLGLLGITMYTVETRMKEISLRKIFGSSNISIIYLLSRGFSLLLVYAVVIAIPLAIMLNNIWLENIAYHTEINFGVIILSVGCLVVLAGVSIFSQMVRATSINPIDTIKVE